MMKRRKTVTRTMIRLTTLMALMSLTACDGGRSALSRTERGEIRYQKAMVEYKAGNLDKAVAELTGVLAANPGNLSARFLLATLQQERKDHRAAFCNFHEFIMLSPKDEKADMARQRMALCEEQLARALAKQMNLTENAAIVRESETARKHLEDSEASVARLTEALAAAQAKVDALTRENARLRRMVAAIGEDEKPAMSPDSVRDILDDDDGDGHRRSRAGAVAVRDEDEVATDTANGLEAARALANEEDGVEGPRSLTRAETTPGAAVSTTKLSDLGAGMGFGRKKAGEAKEPPHEARPETYVVQEGDTLYRIAMRFYGNRNQWKRIREANKATISNDGRVKVGQKIILP
ncbi:MAG: LysM peptidoglycan-binding domain-containing protein [Kiritimatiellia bacterium]